MVLNTTIRLLGSMDGINITKTGKTAIRLRVICKSIQFSASIGDSAGITPKSAGD